MEVCLLVDFWSGEGDEIVLRIPVTYLRIREA